MFQTAQPDPSRCAGDGTLASSKQTKIFPKVTTMDLMNLRVALKRCVIQETLAKRRNGICSEIERAWFVQGSHLEKHRHNLQVSHKLQTQSLMMW